MRIRDDADAPLFSPDYPRPQLVRSRWLSLNGPWDFALDTVPDAAENVSGDASGYPLTIQVPFPPESRASGIGDTGFHPRVRYRREITTDELTRAGWGAGGNRPDGDRVVLHFGAVDYRATVTVGGHLVATHEGGHTPFAVNITDRLSPGEPAVVEVVADDDPLDVAQPRGKQDWELEPHGIWYHRTTGIWQTVWLEVVPAVHVSALAWTPDLARGTVEVEIGLAGRPSSEVSYRVELSHEGEALGSVQWSSGEPRTAASVLLPRQTNGQAYEKLLWSPENPRLIEARVTVEHDGRSDVVSSYLGLRNVGTASGHFMLNDRPYYVRAVLAQGYWPESHLAAPSADALRAEVELAKSMGFNAVRVHQKVEDPRFLMWADRLGLLVWDEAPSHYEFSPTAVTRLVGEWQEVVLRDRSHPSVVTWVPLNESWGVQHIAQDPAQVHYAQALYHLTRALDPTRPVVSNDGWEHAESDILTVHDYSTTGRDLAASYASAAAVDHILSGLGPLGRRMRLTESGPEREKPIMVSEFGGISFAPTQHGAWGYLNAATEHEFGERLRELFAALYGSPVLAGVCYTQLTDTLQEANGLAYPDRTPKIDPALVRSIVQGHGIDLSAHLRPKQPAEHSHELISTAELDRLGLG